MYGAKASRQVFLFEREILISKKKEGGMLGCKSSIQVSLSLQVDDGSHMLSVSYNNISIRFYESRSKRR